MHGDGSQAHSAARGRPRTLLLEHRRAGGGRVHPSMVGASGDPVASNSCGCVVPARDRASHRERTYAVGEPVEVTWDDAPGNKWDWLGVYRRRRRPERRVVQELGLHRGHIAGRATIDGGSEGGPWPLPPGEYDVVLLADDSYQELARAAFTVRR